MHESTWLSIITALVTAVLGCMGILIRLMFSWRASIIEDMKDIKASVKEEINKFCVQNDRSHENLWDRLNHHEHDGEGNVVIPKSGR